MQQQHDNIEKNACITRGLLGRVSTRTNSHNKKFTCIVCTGVVNMYTQLLKVVPAGIFSDSLKRRFSAISMWLSVKTCNPGAHANMFLERVWATGTVPISTKSQICGSLSNFTHAHIINQSYTHDWDLKPMFGGQSLLTSYGGVWKWIILLRDYDILKHDCKWVVRTIKIWAVSDIALFRLLFTISSNPPTSRQPPTQTLGRARDTLTELLPVTLPMEASA
jgi:hypothetical protein